MKYHSCDPDNAMVRTFVAAALLAFALSAEARQTSDSPPWRSRVTPLRRSLPAVTVSVGYEGAYIPWNNVPVALEVTARDASFDGYIGFHFVDSRGVRTDEVPVIARARLAPGGRWSFATTSALDLPPRRDETREARAIVVEWRDRALRVIAIANAGEPPWTLDRSELLPLRLVHESEGASPGPVFGGAAFAASAAGLRDQAQWYEGFSAFVAPLDLWLDLPKKVREAVFGSGIHLVLWGFPRAGQVPDLLDAAILPISFEAAPGSYRAPWPYGDNSEIALPRSWKMKRDANGVGHGSLPYIVRSQIATWSVDESATRHPLPVSRALPGSVLRALEGDKIIDYSRRADARSAPLSERLALYSSAVVSSVSGLVAIAGWLAVRKKTRIPAVLAIVAVPIAMFATREQIRPRSDSESLEVEVSVAAGVVERSRETRSYGASPLPELPMTAESARTKITRAAHMIRPQFEIRNASTPRSMGTLETGSDWGAVSRISTERSIGDVPAVRVETQGPRELVVEFESPNRVDAVGAEWFCGHRRCWGESAVAPGFRGKATIRDGQLLWGAFGGDRVRIERSQPESIWLVERTRRRTRVFVQPLRLPPTQTFLKIPGEATRSGDSEVVLIALPKRVPERADAIIAIHSRLPQPRPSLVLPEGTMELLPAGENAQQARARRFRIPGGTLEKILRNGGIVHLTLPVPGERIAGIENRTLESLRTTTTVASIEIREKKP